MCFNGGFVAIKPTFSINFQCQKYREIIRHSLNFSLKAWNRQEISFKKFKRKNFQLKTFDLAQGIFVMFKLNLTYFTQTTIDCSRRKHLYKLDRIRLRLNFWGWDLSKPTWRVEKSLKLSKLILSSNYFQDLIECIEKRFIDFTKVELHFVRY